MPDQPRPDLYRVINAAATVYRAELLRLLDSSDGVIRALVSDALSVTATLQNYLEGSAS